VAVLIGATDAALTPVAAPIPAVRDGSGSGVRSNDFSRSSYQQGLHLHRDSAGQPEIADCDDDVLNTFPTCFP
jgi:hypothetical protein